MPLQIFTKPLWLYSGAAFLFGCCAMYIWGQGKPALPAVILPGTRPDAECDYVITRLKGFEYTRPVLSVEPKCESTVLSSFKPALSAAVDSLKRAGDLSEASIYLREFKYGEWLSLNGAAQYHPASLMKVSLLLIYLRLAQATPGLLTQKLLFTPPPEGVINTQYYKFPTIEAGKEYTVHELLYNMIAYSDNNATWLLSSRLDDKYTKETFAELGLPEPINDDLKFTMSPMEISVFFKALFNSSFLSPEYSDYAAQMLSNCAFKEGFVGGLPKGTKMWHKFGEWRSLGQPYELHEAGVIYIGETPYLMIVMTRGTDTDKLAGCIRVLSQTVYASLRTTGI